MEQNLNNSSNVFNGSLNTSMARFEPMAFAQGTVINAFKNIKERYGVVLLNDFSKYVIKEKINKLRAGELCCVLIFDVTNGGFIAKEFSAYPEQFEVLLEIGRRFTVGSIEIGQIKTIHPKFI